MSSPAIPADDVRTSRTYLCPYPSVNVRSAIIQSCNVQPSFLLKAEAEARKSEAEDKVEAQTFFEAEATMHEAKATMCEAEAEARHVREQLTVYEHED